MLLCAREDVHGHVLHLPHVMSINGRSLVSHLVVVAFASLSLARVRSSLGNFRQLPGLLLLAVGSGCWVLGVGSFDAASLAPVLSYFTTELRV